MSIPFPSILRNTLAVIVAAAAIFLGLDSRASAAPDNVLTQHIWKLKYGVTDAQLADSNWLNQDSDGDGILNKDEIAAGTNPFDAGSVVRITAIAPDTSIPANVRITFSTEKGKQYLVQGALGLTPPSTVYTSISGATWTGTGASGTPKMLSVPKGSYKFFRVLVQDIDTDGDGVSDWAENAVGLNPNLVQTATGVNDYNYLTGQVYSSGTTPRPYLVTIRASNPSASEDGPAAGTLTVDRTINLFPLAVNYGVSGTALASTDYTSIGTSVSFAAGETSKDISVNPISQAPTVKGSRSVTATLSGPSGGQSFALGSSTQATVIINPSTAATGTGLLARYYDTSSGTYSDAANFGQAGMYAFTRSVSPTTNGTIIVTYTGGTIPGLVVGNQVKVSFTSGSLNSSTYNNISYPVAAVTSSTFTLSITSASSFSGVTAANGSCNFNIQSFIHPATVTRVDPTVNFDWQYGTPNGVTIAPNNSPINYSASWDAYLQPSVAGNYIFQLDAATSARVLLDTGSGLTQILGFNWPTPSGDTVGTFKQSASIPLVVPATPAQRYHIRVEHVETTAGNARCLLQWLVPGATSYVNIPQANQFTHTQSLSYSYSSTNNNVVITPTGGHAFNVNDSVTLSFSTGNLFTPGALSTYNATYTISAVSGTFPTNTFTVPVPAIPISVPGATTTAGSPTIMVPSTNGLAVGMAVSGSGLPASEFITAIGVGMISVTTGTGVTAQASTTLTAVPNTGTGSGFVLNNITSTTTGLYNLCYSNTGFTGSPGRVGVDSAVTAGNNGIWGAGTPDTTLIQPDTFSARWTGQVQPQYSETYTFTVTADDGCALWINGQPQVLKVSPSASTSGSTYLYDNLNGNVMVNYSGLAVPAGSFVLGETVRPDFTSGSLSNNPTTSPTYNYDPTTSTMMVDYTNLTIGQPGGTRVAGSYAIGDTVELDPTSGSISGLSILPYSISAVSGNTFSVHIGTLNFTPTIDITGITTGSPCEITTARNHLLATGNQVTIASVSGGTFSPAINGAYTITVTGPRTFTVASNCTAAPATGTGTVNASGNVNVADSRNLVISKLYASGSTYSYTSGTGVAVITYSALNLPPSSFTAGSTVELAATGGPLAAVKSASYTILASPAPTATTFAVTFPTGLTTTPAGLSSSTTINIAAPVGGTIPASATNAFTVNIGAGKYADVSTGNVSVDIVNKTINNWASNGNERFVRIPMVGGVRYDIQLDYYEASSYAKCILSWYSQSQSKQVIPQERLYPSSLPSTQIAAPAHVSPTVAEALVGGPFSYTVQGSNGGSVTSVTMNGTPLPAWLTYNSGTGVLSGTPPAGAGGDYQILITITNAAGTSTSVVNLHVDAPTGSVVREYWTGVAGTTVASIPTGTNPSGTANLTTLEAPTDFGDNYGARIQGYITAPTTGNYYFWVAANNASELWISNDSESVNAFKRAWVGAGSTTPRTWNVESNQKSGWLALTAGQKYYFQILHKAGTGAGDNLAVGWSKPGEATTAPSEVVPTYVVSPYVAPAAGPTTGTLFVATLLAENGAITNGVGTSTLRLSTDETTAYMTRTYSGLTGAITGEHIHADPYLTHPAAIIYDIDTPATAGDGLITNPSDPNYGSYKWTIAPVGGLSAADIVELIKEGGAYINLHTAAYPNGEIRGNYTLAGGSKIFTAPPTPPAVADDHATNAGAVRFLTQATFGANIADITALKGMASYSAWIDDQFTKSATHHLPEVLAREIADVFGHYDVLVTFDTWWQKSMTAQDQLRQRIAFALSEIVVASAAGPLADTSNTISYYYDTLLDNAFGNFRDVLIGTTLTPSMGQYLNMLGNDKPDLTVGRSPNENYAREIQQLFSIGLYRMWPDGTLVLTSAGAPVPTYTQSEIVGMAHVLTGWYYGYDGPYLSSMSAPQDWTRQMREVPARHFTGTKLVLNNEVLPGLSTLGGQTLDPYATHISTQYNDPVYQALPLQEVNAVHDMLFNHPNVGPFVCRQLIQRLVTSNPSREYVYRVVQAFNDNGSGVRGDMKAVIKAILLDYEARSTDLLSIPSFGKQREPVMLVANAARALRPSNVTGTYIQNGLNTITITTGTQHLLTTGNSVFLDFTDATVGGQPAPSTGVYSVTVTGNNTYTINAPGWITGTYSQTSGSNVMTITLNGHWLPAGGQAYFDFTSGTANGLAGFDQTVRTVVTSTAVDFPSAVGNVSGTTFTITAPDTAARSGNVMISRFSGSYSGGSGTSITIFTEYGSAGGANSYGTQGDHGLSAGDNVFLNFTDSRDTTSGSPTSTQNDLVYPIASILDNNSFTVATDGLRANEKVNSDNQVFIFPLKPQPLVRNGTISTRPGTFRMDTTDSYIGQTPLNSPTVFNFFLPSYKFPGTLASQGMTTPEFQLTSATSTMNLNNYLYNGVFNPATTSGLSGFYGPNTGNVNDLALPLDLTPWMANATDLGLGAGPQTGQAWTSNANVGTLIDTLNTLLLGGQLPSAAKAVILQFIGGQITLVTAGSPCTITTGTAHGLAVGDSVTITGISGATFTGASTTGNGTFTVASVPTSTTVTLTNLNCTAGGISGIVLTNSTLGIISYTNATPSATDKINRLRAILHFLLTSPDYTIQR